MAFLLHFDHAFCLHQPVEVKSVLFGFRQEGVATVAVVSVVPVVPVVAVVAVVPIVAVVAVVAVSTLAPVVPIVAIVPVIAVILAALILATFGVLVFAASVVSLAFTSASVTAFAHAFARASSLVLALLVGIGTTF